ncbi:MAG: (2Fe-2S)-binding protein [Candidatus Competibacter sp.]|nr:(2Fe-2S)-binding protein [Candidatus Competibacter sp.]MDG4583724.1 (2Fe-2S)-binding protein [Candidatus Competibacter sp.]
MYLCICKSVSDKQVREAVDRGARTMGDISARFGIGVECGKCLEDVRQFLDACLLAPPAPMVATAAAEIASPPVKSGPVPERAAWFAVDL